MDRDVGYSFQSVSLEYLYESNFCFHGKVKLHWLTFTLYYYIESYEYTNGCPGEYAKLYDGNDINKVVSD